MDKLSLEREVVLLRCMRDENVFDETRQKFVLLSLKEEVKKYIHRIESLESFIIEQDEVYNFHSVTAISVSLYFCSLWQRKKQSGRKNTVDSMVLFLQFT